MNARPAIAVRASHAATEALLGDAEVRSVEDALFLPDEAATLALGADLALALRRGDLVALSGELGAGKSTLARAVIRALADRPDLEVPSPTYTLVQTYEECDPPVSHLDLYRLGDASELAELGLVEALSDGIALVEWPERAEALLQEAAIVVRLETGPAGGRTAQLSGTPQAMARIDRSLRIRRFLDAVGMGTAKRRHFTGDASSRRYETVEHGEQTIVLMDAPRQPDGPALQNGLPYSRIAHLAEDVAPFVALARTLAAGGFAAPAIHHADLTEGFVLLEHLGTDTLLDAAGRPVPERYETAAACLAAFHARPWSAAMETGPGNTEPGSVHEVPDFDRRAMRIEVDLLPDWYVPRLRGAPAGEEERRLFGEIWSGLFDELRDAETSLVLRDFHSPNIIWRGHAEGCGRIGLIDFQDAVMGPSAYDLASLAQDARVDIPVELEARLMLVYGNARRAAGPFDAFEFERAYAIMAAQRASKVLGIFVRLHERDNKPQYLRHIPRIKTYLRRTLGHPSLAALRSLYEGWQLLDDDSKPRLV